MNPHISLTRIRSSFHLFSLTIIIIIFTKSVPITLCSDPKFEGCAPQSCGNLSSIRYPFWIPSKQESYCGHPSFNITCKDNKNPILKISDDDYLLTYIDYLNDTFHLVNSVVYDDTIRCPTPQHNISIEKSPFGFATTYADFYLFYNCSSPPSGLYKNFPISCAAESRKNGSSYMSFGDFHVEVFREWNYSLGSCQSVVVAPVDIDMNQGDEGAAYWQMNYKEILRQGFTLNWTAHDCGDCEKSGGRCGYDDNQFVCFCRDKSYPKSCHNEKGQSKRAIVIGVGAAASCSIILLSILCFIYQRRHKQQNLSPPSFAQNKFSTVSSAVSDLQTVNGSTYFGVQVFNYKELDEVTDNFNPMKELGDGGFGTVYYGKLRDGREVAIKRLYENNNKRAEQFINEVELLAHLRHKNLVTLYGCTPRQSRELILVYEYVPNGTVADHLHGKQAQQHKLPWPTRLSIAVETAKALVYLHGSDIIHRDVKTQNILLDNYFSVKVADFGLSRLFPLNVTHVSTAPQGTPGYVDPEYHQYYQLTEKSDVYSFGVVLAELISSKAAVDITRRRQEINLSSMLMNKIQNHALHEFVDQSLEFESDCKVNKEIRAVAELAFQCLQSTREVRPSMEEVLEILCNIQGQRNSKELNKADVVDIPADDVFMMKNDLSPSSPPRRYTPYASA